MSGRIEIDGLTMLLMLTEQLDSPKWNTGDNASVEMLCVLTGNVR